MKLPIYMDNHATTPMDPRVFEAMKPYFMETFGNAASRNHSFGWEAEEAVEKARKQIASLIGATAKEIVFTSGATESNNLALKGVAEMYAEKGNHIITAATEHKAILDTCKHLEKHGVRVTYLPVQQNGLVDLEQLQAAITDKTILISIMYANNEIGVIQPIARNRQDRQIERGVLFHTDAAQAVGKVPVNVIADNIDLLSLSGAQDVRAEGRRRAVRSAQEPARAAHRADGWRRPRARHAVGHAERSGHRRDSAKPARSARRDARGSQAHGVPARQTAATSCNRELDEIYINGTMEHRLPNNLNISFAYVEGESLLMGINDIAVSSGSACTSATLEPSYVLKALGAGDDLAHSSIRFGLGRFNTEEEVDYVAAKVIDVVKKLRELSPLYEMAKEGIDLSKVQWAAH